MHKYSLVNTIPLRCAQPRSTDHNYCSLLVSKVFQHLFFKIDRNEILTECIRSVFIIIARYWAFLKVISTSDVTCNENHNLENERFIIKLPEAFAETEKVLSSLSGKFIT